MSTEIETHTRTIDCGSWIVEIAYGGIHTMGTASKEEGEAHALKQAVNVLLGKLNARTLEIMNDRDRLWKEIKRGE